MPIDLRAGQIFEDSELVCSIMDVCHQHQIVQDCYKQVDLSMKDVIRLFCNKKPRRSGAFHH
ncbi:MAG: hypothetical protein B7Z36_02185 [Novosphingobium sp. 12-63-9]|nr:MAG: hypothetical protein B7Z36_02185 [Novosphingobium sp. 12-63-9]